MRVVYIAGPFTAATPWEVAENVRNAERWALKVAECGAMPLCPHANTSLFHGQLTGEFWYEGTLELLKRCDAALFIDGWYGSKGSRAENGWCQENTVPVFGTAHVPAALRHWIVTGQLP